jgi:eukaryotic-like serine/threonine-protein kinase
MRPVPGCVESPKLAAFFAGRLDTTAHLGFAKHLRDCPHCRAEATAMGKPLPANPKPVEVRLPVLDPLELPSAIETVPHVDQIGPYTVRKLLGRGGMGTVYEARHRELDRFVALKVLPRSMASDTDALVRFQREMRALGKLDHPNVVRATDAGEANGVRYLAMDLVDGLDLLQVLRTCGPLDVAEAAEIAKQAARGLAHAHARNIVHRDLKPSNLMLAGSGTVQLLDLGLAVVVSATGRQEDEQLGSMIIGTHDYMAPEQWGEASAVTAKADVYGLGGVLYHALAGHPMFTGSAYRSAQDKQRGHRYDEPPPLPKAVPSTIANFVTKQMLAKDPTQRPTTDEVVALFMQQYPVATSLVHLIERTRLAPGTGFSDGTPTLPMPMLESEVTVPFAVKRSGNSSARMLIGVTLLALLVTGGLAWLIARLIG